MKRTIITILAVLLTGVLLSCEQASSSTKVTIQKKTGQQKFMVSGKMNRQEFWRVIDFAHQHAEGDSRVQEALLVKTLSQYSPDDIIEFECIFRQNIIAADDFRIMAAAKIIEGSVTDDSYVYFRCWLLGLGEKIFTDALHNPDSLAPVVTEEMDTGFEPLLYVATQAYKNKTGKQEEDETFPRDVASGRGLSYDFGSETKGEDWTPEQLPTLLPRLWEKFD